MANEQKTLRKIILSGPVCEKMSTDFLRHIVRLEYENPKGEVTVYVHTYGGLVDDMFCIVDAMKMVSCPNNFAISANHSNKKSNVRHIAI